MKNLLERVSDIVEKGNDEVIDAATVGDRGMSNLDVEIFLSVFERRFDHTREQNLMDEVYGVITRAQAQQKDRLLNTAWFNEQRWINL